MWWEIQPITARNKQSSFVGPSGIKGMNHVNLAHAILYVAVADGLVPRFIVGSSESIVMTGCSVHSEVLFFIWGDYI